MANFISTDYVTATVAALLAPLPVRKYQKRKPTRATDTEYITINALPINADVMQKCICNVNYHVKDLGLGTPDLTKIEAGTKAVLGILKQVSLTSMLIDFESQETIPDEPQSETFSNMRFSIKQINK
jgi:hypothetical protein